MGMKVMFYVGSFHWVDVTITVICNCIEIYLNIPAVEVLPAMQNSFSDMYPSNGNRYTFREM